MPALGLLALRLAIASVLVAHGAHTLLGAWGGPGVGPGGLDSEAARLSALGIEPGWFVAFVTAVVQLAGGALLAVGWLTRWAAAAVLLRVLIDLWWIHLPAGFFLNWTNEPGRGHGLEFLLVVAAALACLLLAGPGDLSFDGSKARKSGRLASERERIRRRL